MKIKTTKRAFIASALSLLLCVSMLIGTTFAWFTDSVASNNNIIKSGNLDIELEYSHDGENWKTVKGSSELFDKDALWEPGYTEVVYLKLSNRGSLALRYDLGVNIISETPGINAEGKAFRLSNFIDMAVIGRDAADIAFATREEAVDEATAQLDGELEMVSRAIVNGYNKSGVMEAGADDIYLAMVVYMPTSVGNEANHNGTDIPEINLGINVFATQAVSENEKDSFGSDYDADAAPVINATYDWYVDGVDEGEFTINTASDLAGLANIVNGTATQEAVSGVASYSDETTYVKDSFKGKTVTLAADIDLMNAVWTPIGNSTYKFQGTFDGNGKTVSNLYIPGYKSNVGLFGFTTDGEIKNLTIENATVYGCLNVGVLAGTPYTTKYNNITVKGHVEVSGMSYVGGVGGKSAYANWDNITVDVDDTSFVIANSIENATSYRTYVGGVIGFMGEGGHTVSNVTSNIDVSGTTCDVGGIVGIAHYGNNFENITCTGDVKITKALEATDAEEMGGIAGVWHNGGSDVTLTNCKFTGTLTANVNDADLGNNAIVGASYSKSGSGKLVIDGAEVVFGAASLDELISGGDAILSDDLQINVSETTANSGYGKTGVEVNNGGVLDGNGNTLTVNDANGTWDCAVSPKNGTIKNLTVNGAFRGIFMGGATGDVYIDNVVIDKVCYTFNSDGGSKDYGVYISNSTLNGWTSYSDVHKEVVFTNCNFGKGTGGYQYAFCRPYNASVFKNCVFEEGFEFDTTKNDNIVFINCYYGETLITAENAATLGNGETTFFYNGIGGVKFPAEVSSAEDLNAALSNGEYVILKDDVTTEAATTAPYGNKVGFVHNGGTFDGNGNAVGITNSGDNYAVMTSGGTIQNLNVNDGFRGIMIMNPTADVVFDNVTVKGDVCYAINTGEGDGTHSLIVTNSTLCGWSSFGTAVKDATFTNCTFGQGDYYDNVYGRLVKPYVDTVFDGCEFESKFYIDLSQLGKDGDGNVLDPDAKIILKNCTVNGVKLTADNWTDLVVSESDCGNGQISIELKDGTYLTAENMVNYIIFE